ncbi:nitroreductase family protein [Aliihoeflea sp. PC F10.4]
MATMSRRLFISSAALAAGAATALPAAAQDAGGTASVSLETALRQRQSIRNYGRDDVEEDQLLRLLWAAGGINRPEDGGRTAPYWQARAVDIYIVRETGVTLYDPEGEMLTDVLDEDILDVISPQGFVARAPVVLVYVSRQAALVEATDRDRADPSLAIGAHVNTAMMAQNVYLFCAAEGLGTCLVGGADRPAIAEALSLGEDDLVTYVQPVGHAR